MDVVVGINFVIVVVDVVDVVAVVGLAIFNLTIVINIDVVIIEVVVVTVVVVAIIVGVANVVVDTSHRNAIQTFATRLFPILSRSHVQVDSFTQVYSPRFCK